MSTYLIQFKGEIEVEAEDPQKAQAMAASIFDSMGEAVKVSEAKVVDKSTGYFVK